MASRMDAIAVLPAPSHFDIVQWQAARAATEVQVKDDELRQVHENLDANGRIRAAETQSEENAAVCDLRVIPPNVEVETKIAAALLMAGPPAMKLDLSGFLLHDVPRSIWKLSMLVKLDLSNNNLQRLPECVTSLENLTCLDVHSNQLTSLPDSVGRLAKLRVLNVSSNSLSAFPETIENCRSLEAVSADFNRITRLPEGVGFELVNLRRLSVHSNRMTHLPSSISHMTCLRVLDVHLNNLRCLPADVGGLVNLEYLNVSQNFSNFVVLPESIGGLRELTEMDVSYNQIRKLPNSVGEMEKLQKLAVEGNPLIEPPPKIVEHGVEAVKQYMKGAVNGGRKRHAGSSWLGHMMSYKWAIRAGRPTWTAGKEDSCQDFRPEVAADEGRRGLSLPAGLFSPRRLFSPRHSSSSGRSPSTPGRNPRDDLYSPRRIYSRLRSSI